MNFKEYYKEPTLLEEGAVLDWFKDKKNRPIVKELANQMAFLGLMAGSIGSMAVYVNKFLSENFPNLGSDLIVMIANYIAKNPQILDWFK